MSRTKKTYEVLEDGHLFGDYYHKGDRIELFPKQAEYDLPPYGTMLREVAEGEAAAAVPVQRARRAAVKE